jgi:hypothetical protein
VRVVLSILIPSPVVIDFTTRRPAAPTAGAS